MLERRPPGGFELAFARWNSHGIGRFCWVMGIDGPEIDKHLLHQAVRITVKRIPGLRSRLVEGYVMRLGRHGSYPIPKLILMDVMTMQRDGNGALRRMLASAC